MLFCLFKNESKSLYQPLSIAYGPTKESEIIFVHETNQFIKNDDYVIGGFWQILQDKQIIPFNKILDRRSALGIDDSNTTLYFFIGNKFSYEDCAKILLQLGATNAIEFDGESDFTGQGRTIGNYQ